MRFRTILKRLCLKSNHSQHKVACLIVKGKRIISQGYNQCKSHTKSRSRYHALHAEVSALLNLRKEQTRGATAYIYRETRDGVSGLSRPCPSCFQALQSAGIYSIIYTITNGTAKEKL